MGKKKKVGHDIPEGFFERLKQIVDQAHFLSIQKTFVARPTTFRVNTLKMSNEQKTMNKRVEFVEAIRTSLEEQGFKIRQVPWYREAFILLNKSKRELTETSLYKEGKIYIQSLASMVPPLVLGPLPGERVLDLTAAPGSKTSQIAMMMDMTGELHANDNNKVRFFKLKHNMELLGVANEPSPYEGELEGVFEDEHEFEEDDVLETQHPITNGPHPTSPDRGGDHPDWKFILHLGDGSHFCGEHRDYFDKILVDAPCSAEARFVNGEPKSYGYWSEKKIKEMAYKQRKLLFSAWVALRPGGTLVYSTCTFAPEENEVQVSKLVERFSDEVEMLDCTIDGLKVLKPLRQWKEKPTHPAVQKAARILPTAEIEGFFVAKLRKKIM